MELTGKAKIEFDKWLDKDFCPDEEAIVMLSYYDETETYASNHFYILPDSMKFGVYVDFFDSVGYYIGVKKCYISNNEFSYSIDSAETCIKFECDLKTRPEARTKAVEKANEIFNNR